MELTHFLASVQQGPAKAIPPGPQPQPRFPGEPLGGTRARGQQAETPSLTGQRSPHLLHAVAVALGKIRDMTVGQDLCLVSAMTRTAPIHALELNTNPEWVRAIMMEPQGILGMQ